MTGESAPSRALRWVVGLTSAAYFMVVLDAVVVITSLQWTVNAYGIAFAGGITPPRSPPASGRRFGRASASPCSRC